MNNPTNIKYTDSLQKVADFLSYLEAGSWNFPSVYSLDYFNWKIAKNPFGESCSYLRFINNVPVAHVSITSKPINIELGIGAFCGELGDTHTHPSYQNQGHFGAIGTAVIDYFQKKNKEAFVFGIPNENAVHGWQSRCNCELLESLNIEELSINILFKKKPLQSINYYNINDEKVKDFINHIWSKTYKRKISLYKKDSNWFEWRYQKSTEKYHIYFSQTCKNAMEAYIIVKITKKYFFTHFQICDIIGLNEDSEISILDKFIKKYISFFSRITIWSSSGTKLNSYLLDKGFKINRKIHFVLFRNKAYEKFLSLKDTLIISQGDTDNV